MYVAFGDFFLYLSVCLFLSIYLLSYLTYLNLSMYLAVRLSVYV